MTTADAPEENRQPDLKSEQARRRTSESDAGGRGHLVREVKVAIECDLLQPRVLDFAPADTARGVVVEAHEALLRQIREALRPNDAQPSKELRLAAVTRADVARAFQNVLHAVVDVAQVEQGRGAQQIAGSWGRLSALSVPLSERAAGVVAMRACAAPRNISAKSCRPFCALHFRVLNLQPRFLENTSRPKLCHLPAPCHQHRQELYETALWGSRGIWGGAH